MRHLVSFKPKQVFIVHSQWSLLSKASSIIYYVLHIYSTAMRHAFIFVGIIVIISCSVLVSNAQEITDLNILRQGGYTLVFRHTAAPGGDPASGGSGNDTGGSTDSLWWMQCDARKSRQLNTQGRTDAITIGLALKRLGIRVSRIASSEFCRCYETAALMNTGLPVALLQGLTMTLYNDNIRKLTMDSLARLAPLVSSTNTVIATHGIPFSDTLYNRIQTLQWGDAAVYRPRVNAQGNPLPDVQPQFIGFIRVGIWAGARPTNVAAVNDANALFAPGAEALSIAPNPAFDRLYVRSEEAVRVKVVNTIGQVVWTDERMMPTRQIPIESWASGAYTVILSDSKRTVSRAFVKLP
jgi:hypothetical protein